MNHHKGYLWLSLDRKATYRQFCRLYLNYNSPKITGCKIYCVLYWFLTQLASTTDTFSAKIKLYVTYISLLPILPKGRK